MKRTNHQKNKRRGLILTLLLHAALVSLATVPYVLTQPAEMEEVLLVEAVEEAPRRKEVSMENVQFRAEKQASKPKAKAAKPKGNPKPTTVEPSPQPEPSAKASDMETVKEPSVEEVEEVKPVDKPVEIAAPKEGKDVGTTGTASKDKTPQAEPDMQSTTKGEEKGEEHITDVDLTEGVFGRRIKRRPNIKGLAKKTGRIAVKVCVNRDGKVIRSQYIKSLSTIHNAAQVQAAERAVKRYRFDQDYTAPTMQCGKITFIFDIVQ